MFTRSDKRAKAILRVCPAGAAAGQSVKAQLVNDGRGTLVFGHAYGLRRAGGGDVMGKCAFTLELQVLGPGKTSPPEEFGTAGRKTRCTDLRKPGTYVFSKAVTAGRGHATLRVRFTVVR